MPHSSHACFCGGGECGARRPDLLLILHSGGAPAHGGGSAERCVTCRSPVVAVPVPRPVTVVVANRRVVVVVVEVRVRPVAMASAMAVAVTMTTAMMAAVSVLLPASVMSLMGRAIMPLPHFKSARPRWGMCGGETGCDQQRAANQ